jgi:hypothetical protein
LTEAAPSVLEGSNGFGALQLLGGSDGLNWARWSLTLSSSLPLSHLLLAACCLSLSLNGHCLLRLELGKLTIAFACYLSHCCCLFLAEYCLLQIAYSLSLYMNIACCRLLLIDHESK